MKELCMFEVGDLVSHGTGYRYVRHIKIKKGGTWIGFGRVPLGLVPQEECRLVSNLKRDKNIF